MSLFDDNLNEYVIKSKDNWKGNSWDLEDTNGNVLGKIKFASWGNGNNSLIDLNESTLLECKRSGKGFLKLAFDCYKIKNSSEALIGKMKKDDSKKTDFVLENSNGEKILQCKSFPSENYFDLYDDADKLVAKIKIHSHKSFTKEIYDVPQSWTLQIQESSFEKLLLLGFCLSLYHFHIATGGGPGV